jgi:DNA cross-link repair 1C protein
MMTPSLCKMIPSAMIQTLYQSHELELSDKLAIGQLERLCREQIEDEKIEDTRVLSRTKEILASAFKSKDKTLLLDQYGVTGEDDISLKELVTRSIIV